MLAFIVASLLALQICCKELGADVWCIGNCYDDAKNISTVAGTVLMGGIKFYIPAQTHE